MCEGAWVRMALDSLLVELVLRAGSIGDAVHGDMSKDHVLGARRELVQQEGEWQLVIL